MAGGSMVSATRARSSGPGRWRRCSGTFAIGNVLPEMAAAHPESGARIFTKAFAAAAGLAALPSIGLATMVTLPELSRSFDPVV